MQKMSKSRARRRGTLPLAGFLALILTILSIIAPGHPGEVTAITRFAVQGQDLGSAILVAAGTRTVGYDITYRNADRHATVYSIDLMHDDVTIARQKGRIRGPFGRLSGHFTVTPAFASGLYTIALTLAHGPRFYRLMRVTRQLVVPLAYTTTPGALSAWAARQRQGLPRVVRQYGYGTRLLAFYMTYTGGIPGHDAVNVQLYDGAGRVGGASGRYIITYETGYIGSTFESFLPLPTGPYHFVVTSAHHVLTTMHFDVVMPIIQPRHLRPCRYMVTAVCLQ